MNLLGSGATIMELPIRGTQIYPLPVAFQQGLKNVLFCLAFSDMLSASSSSAALLGL